MSKWVPEELLRSREADLFFETNGAIGVWAWLFKHFRYFRYQGACQIT
jgi:hypothetical protein